MARRLLGLAAVLLIAAGCGSAAGTTARSNVLPGKTRPKVARIGSLPQAISKASATGLPNGRLMILGGYTGSASVDTILAGLPNKLRVVGHLPQPTHDAAAVFLGKDVYLFGGGSSVSEPTVVRIDPSTDKVAAAQSLGEPLSDLGAVSIGSRAYVVGGYTGTQFATAILAYPSLHVVARLPTGTRYAGVASIGPTIYVAGGLTTAGATRAIYAVSGGKVKKIGSLPTPEDHAALAAMNGKLYYIGGRKVLAIDPNSGKVTVAARLPVSLSDPTATTIAGSRIVVTGGGTNGVWAFTP